MLTGGRGTTEPDTRNTGAQGTHTAFVEFSHRATPVAPATLDLHDPSPLGA